MNRTALPNSTLRDSVHRLKLGKSLLSQVLEAEQHQGARQTGTVTAYFQVRLPRVERGPWYDPYVVLTTPITVGLDVSLFYSVLVLRRENILK